MNKVTKRLLLGLILVVVIGLAFYPRLKAYFAQKKENKEAAAAPAKPPGGGGAMVSVMVIGANRLDNVVKTTGTVLANEEIEIRSEISGKITGLYFKEGQVVTKGAVLIKINDDDLQAQLKKLEYTKKLAEDNEFRQRRLLEKEAISQREYDISLTSVKTIDADIENIKAQIARTTIRAPFGGRLGLRYVSEGSYVTPSTQITTLTSSNPAKVEFSVPAKYADNVRVGSRIEYVTESSEARHTGTVYAIDPKIDPQTRTLQIRALSPNPKGSLIPGSFARIELVIDSKSSAITIPNESVVPVVNGHRVFLVKGGKAVPQSVQVGTRGAVEMEILSGLSPGDTLITTGILQVRPDAPVTVNEVINRSAQPVSFE